MARARNIKPAFFENEQLTEVDAWGRLLFIGLWTLADREGRLEDRPKRVKMQLFPMDDVDIDRYLDRLTDLGFIARYSAEGMACIQVINFAKHQRPHNNEAQSVLPEMPGLTTMMQSAASHGEQSEQPEDTALRSESLNTDSLNDESLNTESASSAPRAKRKSLDFSHDSDEYRIARLLATKIHENNPKAKTPTEAILQRWANTVRLMVEQDERDYADIRAVLLWAQASRFWFPNILSMDKLREKFDTISGQMIREELEANERPATNGTAAHSGLSVHAKLYDEPGIKPLEQGRVRHRITDSA